MSPEAPGFGRFAVAVVTFGEGFFVDSLRISPSPSTSHTTAGGGSVIRLPCDGPDMAELLSDDEIDRQVPDGWERDGDEIVKVYEFDDYLKGVEFATRVGEVAEEEFHHPEMRIRYEEVEVRLTSHEEGGITDQDVRLANLFDEER